MKGQRKKIKALAHDEETDLEKNEFKCFVEAVDEDLLHRIKVNPDPLESYFHTKCHRWIKDTTDSCARIESGYQTMLKELFHK